MKRWTVLSFGLVWIFLGLWVMAQESEFLAQKFQIRVIFDDLENWENIWETVSGEWKLTNDETAPAGPVVLTQSMKFLDFPKIFLGQSRFFDFHVGVDLKILPVDRETQPSPGHSLYEIPPEKAPEIARPRDYAGGILLRYRGPFIFLALMADARLQKVVLVGVDLAGPRVLAGKDATIGLNQWHRLEAVCETDLIQVYWDGAFLFQHRERGLTGGRVGLITTRSSRVYFDRFILESRRIFPRERFAKEKKSKNQGN